MKIAIVPERPVIFLGQKFTLQINVTDCDPSIGWISAQITGKTRTLNEQTNRLLHGIVEESLGGPQNAPYFGHVMSGSHLLTKNFTGNKSFNISITADHIPPSYDGVGSSVTYELMIAYQTSEKIDKSNVFPIRFVAPFSYSADLEHCQANASFSIESSEGDSVLSPFYLSSPFVQPTSISQASTEIVVRREGGTVATIQTPLAGFAGKELTGLIDQSNSDSSVKTVTIQLLKNEKYEANEKANNSIVVSQKIIPLESVVMQRFNLCIPHLLTANFSTSLVAVSYSLEFLFTGKQSSWKWAAQFDLGPPEYSQTKPRTPFQKIKE